MKKLLAVLIATTFAMSSFAADKKSAPVKKVAKKHQRFDGTKVADDKGTKPAAPKKKK
jgi:Ni/Co efflux regulator RcnB